MNLDSRGDRTNFIGAWRSAAVARCRRARAVSCAVRASRLTHAGSVLPFRSPSAAWRARSAASRSAWRSAAAIVVARVSVIAGSEHRSFALVAGAVHHGPDASHLAISAPMARMGYYDHDLPTRPPVLTQV